MNFCFWRGSIPRRVWRAGAPPFLARKSGGHCTHPTGGPSLALNIKKLERPRRPKQSSVESSIVLFSTGDGRSDGK